MIIRLAIWPISWWQILSYEPPSERFKKKTEIVFKFKKKKHFNIFWTELLFFFENWPVANIFLLHPTTYNVKDKNIVFKTVQFKRFSLFNWYFENLLWKLLNPRLKKSRTDKCGDLTGQAISENRAIIRTPKCILEYATTALVICGEARTVLLRNHKFRMRIRWRWISGKTNCSSICK